MILAKHGRNIYFDIVGPESAPVIYLAHPLAADSGMWAEQIFPLLAAGYRVLRADMRGHGGSAPAPGNARMEHLVEDAIAVIDHLAIPKLHVCGLSIGGMIAQGIGIFHPDRVISLILCDTRAAAPANALERWGPRIAQVQAENSLRPLAAGTMERWLSPQAKQRHPILWQQIHDTIAASNPHGYISCTAAIQSFSWLGRLAEISAPTLVLCGADDPGADPEENLEIAKTVQNGRFHSIEGARHLPNVEDADLFNALIIEWLKEHTI